MGKNWAKLAKTPRQSMKLELMKMLELSGVVITLRKHNLPNGIQDASDLGHAVRQRQHDLGFGSWLGHESQLLTAGGLQGLETGDLGEYGAQALDGPQVAAAGSSLGQPQH